LDDRERRWSTADRSNPFNFPQPFLKASLAGGRMRRPSSASSTRKQSGFIYALVPNGFLAGCFRCCGFIVHATNSARCNPLDMLIYQVGENRAG
jgi:hypothetical protein